MSSVLQQLQALGYDLPTVATPLAKYVLWQRSGNLLHLSGQLPMRDGKLIFSGKLGADVSIEDGQAAARLVALNLLAVMQEAIGDLDRVNLLKLTGFVNCTPEFTQAPAVINGASELFVAVMPERGLHARSAVGVASLPLGAAVEIDAVVEILDAL